MTHTILIAEDDPVQRSMIAMLLTKKLGYEVIQTSNGKEAWQYIQKSNIGEIAAVLMDIAMPEMDGFEALAEIRKYRPDLPVVMLTGNDDTSVAVRAIKEGASDFIVKPPVPAAIDVALKNAIKIASLSQEIARLKRDKEGALLFSDLIGSEGGLREAVAFGRKAAASDVPVLVMGETGSGKELFARALHGQSRRVGAPFIAINCGALPENLVESILFGHEKGSFTGAITRTIGKFREAEGGTIFLDEIGELPLDAQVKLLRVLQQKEVEPVGAGKPVKINVRIISATNRDLKADVKEGRFREDLFFRLNVLPITLPPLRERKDDIISLAEYFIERLSAADNLPPRILSKDAANYLISQSWAGNVRELENLVHRALVMSDGDHITRTNLQQIHDSSPVQTAAPTASSMSIALMRSDGACKPMADIEAEAMHTILAHFEGNITRAADSLGIAKSTFYRKIKDTNG
jgi:DNA-binding NtrC family response regulator